MYIEKVYEIIISQQFVCYNNEHFLQRLEVPSLTGNSTKFRITSQMAWWVGRGASINSLSLFKPRLQYLQN